MSGKEILYLSQTDVISAGLSMADIIQALEVAFREKGLGRVEMPPKPGVHPGAGDNFIHAMPAYIPAMNAAGVKWVAGYPDNYKLDLPYITGLLILNDPSTGVPTAVMDCVWITAMRTGAASALSAKYLARPDSSTVGILGCGVQGRSNLEAMDVLFPLKRVFAYDRSFESAQRYAREMSVRMNLDIVPVKEPRQAVSGCDIVVTAGPILRTPHATIQAGWLDEGAFASLVDFDSFWHPAAMHQVNKFTTDDVPQLLHYKELGYFQDIPTIYSDLGELVAGLKPGRQSAGERTMACNLGLALDDMAVAPLVYDKARQVGLGVHLPL